MVQLAAMGSAHRLQIGLLNYQRLLKSLSEPSGRQGCNIASVQLGWVVHRTRRPHSASIEGLILRFPGHVGLCLRCLSLGFAGIGVFRVQAGCRASCVSRRRLEGSRLRSVVIAGLGLVLAWGLMLTLFELSEELCTLSLTLKP